jgi:hypothetical protein
MWIIMPASSIILEQNVEHTLGILLVIVMSKIARKSWKAGSRMIFASGGV